MKALIFGHGYLGSAFAKRLKAQDWTVAATARDPGKRDRLAADGIIPIDPAEPAALTAAATNGADAVLVTAAPEASGCPALKALLPALAGAPTLPGWIGYVSSTGVYGDREGGWVFEESELNAPSVEGARRAAAERDWQDAALRLGLTLCVFRLPAIYGPGRAPFERLREGTARRVVKPGQVFNRIHVDDAVSALTASIARPRAGGVYNVCDDRPAGAEIYVAEAADLAGLPQPPQVPWTDDEVSAGMRRFYADNKRVSNARAKAELGWRPKYADWRDGLTAILAAGG